MSEQTKDRVIVECSSVDASGDLAGFIMGRDDIEMKMKVEDGELPIGADDTGFDIEPSDDIFYDDGVNFDKCDYVVEEILEMMRKLDVRYREAVAILHKLHTAVDVEGGDALDA